MKKLAYSLFILLIAAPVLAQQTGSASGIVTDSAGQPLPGVTVEASADVLPRARVAVTGEDGRYRFQFLPPGNYEFVFTLEGIDPQARDVAVLLERNTVLDVTLGLETVTEELRVVAAAPTIDTSSAEIKTAIGDQVIGQLPVGQEYRDIVKLIPGVQYTEDSVRGPSAGGSGQDNVYLFDGVNVGLPLFGTLSAEPSSHDIEQVSILRGGAKAIDFNRSGGFTINSVSKSGTNRFRGQASYQVQTEDMEGDRDTESAAEFESDRDWATFGFGGPLVEDQLFFYTSYYRPTITRDNRSNFYGSVPDAESERDEFFGKLSWTPTDDLLIHASYRDSDRTDTGTGVTGEAEAGSTSEGGDATLEIAILEGTWVLGPNSFLDFSYTDFSNDNRTRPDNLFGFDIRDDGSVGLNVNALDTQGLFLVPAPVDGETAFNDFIQPLIDQYGFLENGVRTGGGQVGGGSTINDQNFARENFDVGYDHILGRHELHFGYSMGSEVEELSRTSNGWGVITVPGGRAEFNGQPVFYEARFEQQGLLSAGGAAVPAIESEFEHQSFEINDVFRLEDWTFSAGVLVSNDELFGEGLRENSGNVSGFELAPGSRYKMYEIDFEDMIQPRLAATWSYNARDTVYASYAKYHPAAISLPRAASWARNLRRSIRGYFDADGNLIGVDPVRSSSGKFFQEDMDPRSIDEFLLGHSRQIGSRWTAKGHVRYRYGHDYWEDTNNTARVNFNPPDGIPQELYIPNLDEFRGDVGGSSYVIAELDGAFTKYWEVSTEAEYRGRKTLVKGSYVWSHYYGNFDQDNTTTSNDANVFVGSSFIADGVGRQLWNFRYGDLRGDRRHQLKVYGYYNFDFNGTVGAYAIYQSGQPWEAWNREIYRCLDPLGGPRDETCNILGTTSSSDTSRFSEPAGSRTTSDHYQLDLSYTHNFPLRGRFEAQVRADVFNVFDKQTGYNIQNKVNSAGFGTPRSFYDPRTLQVAVRLLF